MNPVTQGSAQKCIGETCSLKQSIESLRLKDLSNVDHRLGEFRGDVVIVSFGASWCPMCKLELHSLEALHHRFQGKGIQVFLVLVDDSLEAAKKLQDEERISYPILLDAYSDFKRTFQLGGLPQSLVLARDGSVRVLASPNGRTLAPYTTGAGEADNEGMPNAVDWSLPPVVDAVSQLLKE